MKREKAMGWRARRAAAALLAAVLLAAGCTSDSSPSSDAVSAGDGAGAGAGKGSGSGDATGGDDGHGHGHAGAGGAGDKPAFTATEADTRVGVTMTDFAFAGVPATVQGDKVMFEVTNQGPSEHEFVVFPAGADDDVGGFAPVAKGRSTALAVTLKPGTYTVKCLIKLGDKSHADLGMQTDFIVG